MRLGRTQLTALGDEVRRWFFNNVGVPSGSDLWLLKELMRKGWEAPVIRKFDEICRLQHGIGLREAFPEEDLATFGCAYSEGRKGNYKHESNGKYPEREATLFDEPVVSIYAFIAVRADYDGQVVKIGSTQHQVDKYIAGRQGFAKKRKLGVTPGTRSEEEKIHQCLKDFVIRGIQSDETYYPVKQVLEWIEGHMDTVLEYDLILQERGVRKMS